MHPGPRWQWLQTRYTAPTVVTIMVLLSFGLDMLLEPRRYSATPAYANLLQIFHIQTWGWLYLAIGLLIIATRAAGKYYQNASRVAYTLGFVLCLAWEGAFFIRWRTDDHTTIANVVAWGLYTLLIAWTASRPEKTVE